MEQNLNEIGTSGTKIVNKRELIALINKHFEHDRDAVAVITTVENGEGKVNQTVCFGCILE